MKLQSIKFRITFWYTIIILLILGVILGGTFYASEYYSESVIKEQLLDEVGDMQELLEDDIDDINERDLISYDDGVMISIYDESKTLIAGAYPDILSDQVPLKHGVIQKVNYNADNWFIYDLKMNAENGVVVWIRGASSFSPMISMVQRMAKILTVVFPILVFLIAFIGYRMINRSLCPIYTISQTVDKIIQSSNLSVRLDTPIVKDEFAYLTNTFNQLLEHLEQQFLREQQFSSDAAHELRTPVSVILSHCEYCLEELDPSEEAREELLIIQKKALQMSSLISTLLAIARAESNRYHPEFEEIDLEILAESIIDELSEKADSKSISLTLDNQMLDPLIEADMSMLTRLFVNLIDNAIAYGKENGNVKVIMEQNVDQVILTITDDGIGIPSDALDKIWNRFYQVDSSHTSSGFGLGLFLVKHIIQLHNGNVSVESELGKGTSFIITLPKKRTD